MLEGVELFLRERGDVRGTFLKGSSLGFTSVGTQITISWTRPKSCQAKADQSSALSRSAEERPSALARR